jgi:hypothetical protein
MAFKEKTNAKRQKHREKSRELCALKQKIKIKKERYGTKQGDQWHLVNF